MDWVSEDRNRLSNAVQDWIVRFLIAKEPHAEYREALVSVLQTLWPGGRSAEGSPGFILLPGLCAQALGVQPSKALPLHAAWAVLYIAYYLLDKVEDEETDHAIFARYGAGTVNNLTTGMILHAQRMLVEGLTEVEVDAATRHALQTAFNQRALAVCAGQHLDLSLSYPSLKEAWEIAGGKSGEFFALGALLAARLATEDAAVLDVFSRFGWRLGMVIQIANDIHGLGTIDEVGGDLAQGKRALPAAYALHILPPDQREQLSQLLEKAPEDPLAEVEARKQIINAGALTYLALEIERFRHQATVDLQPMGEPAIPLLNLLQRMVDTRSYMRRGPYENSPL